MLWIPWNTLSKDRPSPWVSSSGRPHLTGLLDPDTGQINPSAWHRSTPWSCRHKSDMHAMCYICSWVVWVLRKRNTEPVLCQNIAPVLPSSPLPRLRTRGLTCEAVFLPGLLSAFHLFPGMAFLKHLELVTSACTCEVRVICLAQCFSRAVPIQIYLQEAFVCRRHSVWSRRSEQLHI